MAKFELDSDEFFKYHAWWKNHKCNGRYSGAIGGAVTFKITSTSLGDIVKAQCGFSDCNEEICLTNFDGW